MTKNKVIVVNFTIEFGTAHMIRQGGHGRYYTMTLASKDRLALVAKRQLYRGNSHFLPMSWGWTLVLHTQSEEVTE